MLISSDPGNDEPIVISWLTTRTGTSFRFQVLRVSTDDARKIADCDGIDGGPDINPAIAEDLLTAALAVELGMRWTNTGRSM
jgi:hypothetical protein